MPFPVGLAVGGAVVAAALGSAVSVPLILAGAKYQEANKFDEKMGIAAKVALFVGCILGLGLAAAVDLISDGHTAEQWVGRKIKKETGDRWTLTMYCLQTAADLAVGPIAAKP